MRIGGFNRYRNAVGTVARREAWYSELTLNTANSIASDGLAIDDKYLYVKAANGHALQAIDKGSPGKLGTQTEILASSMEQIVDWTTAPYDNSLVAACDSKGAVELWNDCKPVVAINAHEMAACNSVRFHPTVAGVLATTSNSSSSAKNSSLRLWNISSSANSAFWDCAVDGIVDSIAIRGDGQLLSASTHDGLILLFDPRNGSASGGSAIAKTASVYAAGRPTRCIWLGDKPYLLSTGLSRMRERSAALWDQRNLAKPLASLKLQQSTKPLIPLFDEDTQIAYLGEKGDNTMRWVDADPSSANPLAELGSVVLQSQISGCALMPKRSLRVMSGEIARVHVVVENSGAGTGSAVIPISHVVPRRSYLDFHADLFPDTRAPFPAQSFEQWVAQEPFTIPKVSLDPSLAAASMENVRRRFSTPALSQQSEPSAAEPAESVKSAPKQPDAPMQKAMPTPEPTPITAAAVVSPQDTSKPATGAATHTKTPELAKEATVSAVSAVSSAPVAPLMVSPAPQTVKSPTVSKKQWRPAKQDNARFKYIEGFLYRPSLHYTNIKNVNLRFSQENDPLRVSSKFIAVACEGAGGQVGIIRRDSPGRVPTKLPTIVHGSSVVSIEFDPFDPNVVATAGVDGKLQMWRIPDAPMSEDTVFELAEYICITADRIHQIQFHPWAPGVVAVLVSDADEQAVYVYHGLMLHFIVGKTKDGIHSFAWSPDGECIVLATKTSRQLRIYSPRTQDLMAKGPSMDSIRPCRIAWVNNSRICLSGFGHGSQRQIAIYDSEDLSRPLAKSTIDVGPGLLVPLVDADCGIVYLDDRGSRLTHAFELVDDSLFALPKLECSEPSLGLAMLPKKYANVAKCEVSLFYRLNSQSVESIGFRVPRKRPEYFQDDLFPDTQDVETPAVHSAAWISGTMASPHLISLCPQGMVPLSQAPPEAIRRPTFQIEAEKSQDNTKDAISAMLSRVDISDEERFTRSDVDSNGSGSDWDD